MPLASQNEAAQPWLEKMIEFYDRAPFAVDYEMTMNIQQGDQNMNAKATGNILYRDQTHMRMSLDIAMMIPNMPQEMRMAMLMVFDGEVMWSEVDNPMAGKQVIKMGISELESAAQRGGFGSFMSNRDPISQLRALQEMTEFSKVEVADGLVTLEGAFSPEALEKMGPGAASMMGALRLVLDADTALPKSVVLGTSEAPTMTIDYTKIAFLDESELEADAFVYAPPEGVPVMENPGL